MSNLKVGDIYELRCAEDCPECDLDPYIGSTVDMTTRKSKRKGLGSNDNTVAREIMVHYEITGKKPIYKILETIFFRGKKELRMVEQEWMDIYGMDNILNRNRAYVECMHGGYDFICKICDIRFKCPKCDKRFTKKSNITRHIRGVHHKIKHHCLKCGMTFTQKTNLGVHEKKFH